MVPATLSTNLSQASTFLDQWEWTTLILIFAVRLGGGEGGRLATVAPPRPGRGRCARSAGPGLGDTATTGDWSVLPAELSSEGECWAGLLVQLRGACALIDWDLRSCLSLCLYGSFIFFCNQPIIIIHLWKKGSQVSREPDSHLSSLQQCWDRENCLWMHLDCWRCPHMFRSDHLDKSCWGECWVVHNHQGRSWVHLVQFSLWPLFRQYFYNHNNKCKYKIVPTKNQNIVYFCTTCPLCCPSKCLTRISLISRNDEGFCLCGLCFTRP